MQLLKKKEPDTLLPLLLFELKKKWHVKLAHKKFKVAVFISKMLHAIEQILRDQKNKTIADFNHPMTCHEDLTTEGHIQVKVTNLWKCKFKLLSG